MLCATVILELKLAIAYCYAAIFTSLLDEIRPETLRIAANGLVMLLYGSNNYDGNINKVRKGRVRYIDESFDYLRIKVETWNSNILFFFFTL